MAGPESVALSGENSIDALLTEWKWDTNNLTFSFPDSGWYYVEDQFFDIATPAQLAEFALLTITLGPAAAIAEIGISTFAVALVALNGFQEFNDAQKVAARYALDQFEGVSGLNFTEGDEGFFDHEDLRFAETASTSAPAFGIPPIFQVEFLLGEGVLGDTWYLNDGTFDNPMLGSFAHWTIMHEVGHAIGFKHAHESGLFGDRIPDWLEIALTGVDGPVLDPALDSLEFTIMTYTGTPEAFGHPQSLMMLDIQAAQYMYGADFNHNSGDTTYSWDPATGAMSIDGTPGPTPGANRVFLTIWDGNGNDTYDLSSYTTDVNINLLPGQWTLTSTDQLADLNGGDRTSGLAVGNVANALLFDDDPRSLIENAIGGSGDDTLTGNDLDNLLVGNAGNDSITGALGEDTLDGGTGNDTLDGGGDADTLLGGAGNDSIIGAGGADSVDGGDDADTIDGGEGADSLGGGGGNDSIASGSGDDTVAAGAGNDTVTGNGGADFLRGEDGDDTVLGEDGADDIGGGAGNDSLGGGIGDDTIDGGSGDNTITGGEGLDSIVSGDGNDSILGGDGSDTVAAGGGMDTVFGEEGDDVLDAGAGDDEASGGEGNDTIDAGSGNDTVDGGNGADSVTAGAGDDSVLGGAGDDTILGAAGMDTLMGETGEDLIHGGEDVDLLSGGLGNDDLFGEEGNDSLFGNEGNDTLAGGSGADTLDGGDGIDMASYSDATGPVVINLQDPTQTTGDAAGDVLISIEQFGLSDFDDLFIGLDDPLNGDVVFGRGGNDTLLGFAGDDTLHGEDGDDSIVGGEGADDINGGDGFDTTSFLESDIGIIVDLVDPSRSTGIAAGDVITSIEEFEMSEQNDEFVGLATGELIHGFGGNDTVFGNGGDDTIEGGIQHDWLFGGDGNDQLLGESGLDMISGDDGDDTLDGGADNDILAGGNGNDALMGGTENDELVGGLGDDELSGGEGRDVFAILAPGWGVDRVIDFEDGWDSIEIDGFEGPFGRPAMANLNIYDDVVAGGAVVELAAGGGDQLILVGIAASDLNHQDFVFV